MRRVSTNERLWINQCILGSGSFIVGQKRRDWLGACFKLIFGPQGLKINPLRTLRLCVEKSSESRSRMA